MGEWGCELLGQSGRGVWEMGTVTESLAMALLIEKVGNHSPVVKAMVGEMGRLSLLIL